VRRKTRGEVSEGTDLPPRKPGLAEFTGIGSQQFSGRHWSRGRHLLVTVIGVPAKLPAIKVSGYHLIPVIVVGLP
jgi:hypothetical protein